MNSAKVNMFQLFSLMIFLTAIQGNPRSKALSSKSKNAGVNSKSKMPPKMTKAQQAKFFWWCPASKAVISVDSGTLYGRWYAYKKYVDWFEETDCMTFDFSLSLDNSSIECERTIHRGHSLTTDEGVVRGNSENIGANFEPGEVGKGDFILSFPGTELLGPPSDPNFSVVYFNPSFAMVVYNCQQIIPGFLYFEESTVFTRSPDITDAGEKSIEKYLKSIGIDVDRYQRIKQDSKCSYTSLKGGSTNIIKF